MAVKYYNELLNYIDIPVLSIHVRGFINFYLLNKNFILFRVNKNKRNEHIHFLNFVMLKLEFYCVRM